MLYEGETPPADLRQCLEANDDIPDAFDTGDSEILGLTVPASGAVIVVSTTFTYEEATNIGTGAYITIVTNAD